MTPLLISTNKRFTRPMVSVVIATFNGANFVAASLQSVLSQTQRPAEIVVVDDRSTDNTSSIVQSFALKSSIPFQFIRLSENSGGPSRPINVGIEAAKSEYLALLDQDDLMRPGRIAAQQAALDDCPQCSIAIGRFSIIGEDENDLTPMWPVSQLDGLEHRFEEDSEFTVVDSEAAFRPLLKRNYAGSSSNFCFSRDWWQKIGRFDETVRTCPDLDFMLRAAMAGPVAVLNQHLFEYRWSSSSLQRRNVTRSLLEATMVRLRAASEKPEWAGDDLKELRHSALILANASVRKGDFQAVRAIAETLSKHKGLEAVKERLNEKARRLMGLPGR